MSYSQTEKAGTGYFYAVVPTMKDDAIAGYKHINLMSASTQNLQKILTTKDTIIYHTFNYEEAQKIRNTLCKVGIAKKQGEQPKDETQPTPALEPQPTPTPEPQKAPKDNYHNMSTIAFGYMYTDQSHMASVSYDKELGRFIIGGEVYIGGKEAGHSSKVLKVSKPNPDSSKGLIAKTTEEKKSYTDSIDAVGGQLITGINLYKSDKGNGKYRLDLLAKNGVVYSINEVAYETLTQLLSQDDKDVYDKEIRKLSDSGKSPYYIGGLELRLDLGHFNFSIGTGLTTDGDKTDATINTKMGITF